MALRKSTQANMRVMAPNADEANDPLAVYAEHTIVAGAFALNDVVEMIPWPAYTIPISLKIQSQDCDSNGTPLVSFDFGVLTGQYLNALNDDLSTQRTCGQEFGAGSTIGRTGGTLDVAPDLLLNATPKSVDQSIGFKIAAAAATLTAGAKIRFVAMFLPVPQGVVVS